MGFVRPWLAGLACSLVAANVGLASDFAIETHVYTGDESEPIESYLTIFQGAKIYDLRTKPDSSTIVFDRNTRNFQISRSEPAMQSTLASDEIVRFSAALQQKAENSKDPLVKFAANPEFELNYDAADRRLSLTSPMWDYIVDVQTVKDPDVLGRYREFADWFTYLNCVFRPLPPGLRIELNRVLYQHHAIPKQVLVHVKRAGQQTTQRSEHKWIQPLGSRELAAIEGWATEQGTLPKVRFAEYRAAGNPRR